MFTVGLTLNPCHRTPGSLPGGWARGQIIVHLENVVILLIKIASRQKAFILGQDVHWTLTFILWHLTPRSTPGVGARGQNLELFKLLYFFSSRSSYLETTDQKAVILGPKVTWKAL